ncbi:TetR/AcrR family transcriptional regulator [Nonomuraea sp. KM90]|uniref:TetR/AcrR family transcriptional regulator n=1 Tax=Nonomuraea sp. KM90 TaxID=3457428 RepID=UPI003FCEC5F6
MSVVREQIVERLPVEPESLTLEELRLRLPVRVTRDYLRKALARLAAEGVVVKSELSDAARAMDTGNRWRARVAFSLARHAAAGDGLAAGQAAAEKAWGGKGGGQQQDDQARRLIGAGFDLFGRVGLAGTQIGDLAREARCSMRSYYTLFGSKERLLAAVIDRCAAELAGEARARWRKPGGDWVGEVCAVVAAHVEMVAADGRLHRIVYVERHHLIGAYARPNPLLTVLGVLKVDVPEAGAGAEAGAGVGVAGMRLVLGAVTGAVDALLTQRYHGEDLPTGQIVEVAGRVLRAMLEMPGLGEREPVC